MVENVQGSVEDVVCDVIEGVFRSVEELAKETLELHRARVARGEVLTDLDVTSLGPLIRRMLHQPGEIALGLGLILEPGLLATHPRRLEWWESDGSAEPTKLQVDLNPESLGFYDYEANEWFAVPRTTRRRHIAGPYVDVHGTGRYLLTLTIPLIADGEFLGVAGADVALSRFETLVLRQLGRRSEAVVVNAERRVVVSTTSRWITGSLCPCSDPQPHSLPALPWEVFVPA